MLAQFYGGYVADVGRPQGLSSFTTAMLDEGTTSRTALEIAADAERLGAKLSAYARLETNNVRLSALKSNLAPSLALMTDVIRNPAFSQPDIDRVQFAEIVSPEHFVAVRDRFGGPAPAPMEDALAAYQEKAAAFAREATENAAREAAAAEELRTRFTALMGAA